MLVEVEHIGSTSVAGLAAKPIIDLMAATGSLSGVTAQDETLRTLGYERHDTGMPGRLFYRRDRAGRRTHQLHVVTADSWPTRNERILRDHLRDHPADAARYGALKRSLSSEHSDSLAYTRAKTDLIQELTDRARAELGLPSVPVQDEALHPASVLHHVVLLIHPSGSAFPRDRRYVRRLVEALDGALKTDAVTQHGGVLWLSATS